MHENSHPGGSTEKPSEFIKRVIHFNIFVQISFVAFIAQLSSQLLPPIFYFIFFLNRLILQSMDQMQEEISLNQNDLEDRPFSGLLQ